MEKAETGLPAPVRMILPCRWNEGGLADFAGRVRYRRSFGRPGRLDDNEHVWLTFAAAESAAEAWLNGHFLGSHDGPEEAFEFEITSLLRERNELIVEVESAIAGGLYGEVALEVRLPAFLRSVRAWCGSENRNAILNIAGEIWGNSEQPLELYAVWGRLTVAYRKVGPLEVVTPFHLISQPMEDAGVERPVRQRAGCQSVHVELVSGGTVWYAVDIPVEMGEGRGEE